MSNKSLIPLICSQADIAKVCGMTPNNINTTYVGVPKKQSMLKALDMGTYCILNEISHSELKLFLSMSVEVKRHIMEKING